MPETLLPTVQWAQRSEKLYLTIDLQEAKEPKIELSNGEEGGKLSFSGSAQSHAAGAEGHQYALELELYGKLVKADSKIAVGARSIVLIIVKEEAGFWPRLTRAAGKAPRNIKIDWNKWVDEDEEEEKGDFDMSSLQNMQNYDMGGGGGMGGGGMGGMPPGMESMMGGMGGGGGSPGGMPDMAELMKKMGGKGGAGGAGGGAGGGADLAGMQEMLKKMSPGAGGMAGEATGGQAGSAGGLGDSDSEDDVPPLEAE